MTANASVLLRDCSAGLLALACVVAPIPLGCTGEWSRFALEGLVVLAVVLGACTHRSARAWRLLVPPVVAALFTLQLLPLPDRLLTSIAPVSGGAWKVANEGLPSAWGTVTIDPAATAAAIRRLLLCLATVAIVQDLAADVRQRRILLAGLTVSAVVVLALGLAFPVNPNRRVLLNTVPIYGPIEFWRDPIVPPVQTAGWAYLEWITVGTCRYLLDVGAPGDGFGSYISTNQFPAGVYLTLPVALGLILYASRARLSKPMAYALILAVMAGATWVVAKMAGSRAGTLSTVMTCLTMLWLTTQSRWLQWLLGITTATFAMTVLVFTCVLFGHIESVDVLVPDAWQKTVEMVRADGRVVAADVALRMFRASPLLGTGLATFGDLYTRFIGKDLMHYAHNDYLQCLAEAGCMGLILMAAGMAILGRAFSRFRRGAAWPESLLGAGPWAALAGIAAHSAFDWNLHVPANAFLACVVAGICLASGGQARATTGDGAITSSWWRFLPPFVLSLSCMGSLVFLARDAWSDAVQRRIRAALVEETMASRDPHRPPAKPALEQALEAGRFAAHWDPANSNLALLNGRVCLHLTELSGPKSRAAFAAESERWYLEAQRNCAIRRGLPEPLPKPPPRPR